MTMVFRTSTAEQLRLRGDPPRVIESWTDRYLLVADRGRRSLAGRFSEDELGALGAMFCGLAALQSYELETLPERVAGMYPGILEEAGIDAAGLVAKLGELDWAELLGLVDALERFAVAVQRGAVVDVRSGGYLLRTDIERP